MAEHLLLLDPSANRVYAGHAADIAAAQVRALASVGVGAPVVVAEPVQVAGARYLRVVTPDGGAGGGGVDAGESDGGAGGGGAGDGLRGLRALEPLALFAREGELLRPVDLGPGPVLDTDLLTIPKYPGKTNERLTQAVLTLALAAAGEAPEAAPRSRRPVVLDPLAGRGTTLSWALALGCSAIGVERERREVEAYAAFLTTWLRRKRLKHLIDLAPLKVAGAVVAHRLSAELAPSAAAWRAKERQELEVFAADTLQVPSLLGKRRVDVVLADAPYGVAHTAKRGGSRQQPSQGSRSPRDLLAAALPGWVSVLRRGGALALVWNTHGLARGDLAALCEQAGLHVMTGPGWDELAHPVDAGIHRDVLVARKP